MISIVNGGSSDKSSSSSSSNSSISRTPCKEENYDFFSCIVYSIYMMVNVSPEIGGYGGA